MSQQEDGSSAASSSKPATLTALQKERIEISRQRALKLKEIRNKTKPYTQNKWTASDNVAVFDKDKNVVRVYGTKFVDTGGGFLLEEKEGAPEEEKDIVDDPQPILHESDKPKCEECSEFFNDSFLMTNYSHPVCDKCRNNEEEHALITRTDAKNTYLLKDCDFDKREPPLKFLLRKNPHDSRWGDMKLYLQLQVEDRAMEVWGSLETLEQERELREEKREKSKAKKYSKHMKGLRMQVRSSLFDKTKANHKHEFGSDTDLGDGNYSHTCSTCGYEETFEKM